MRSCCAAGRTCPPGCFRTEADWTRDAGPRCVRYRPSPDPVQARCQTACTHQRPSSELLPTPEEIKRLLPLPPASKSSSIAAVAPCAASSTGRPAGCSWWWGPCSIHDPKAAASTPPAARPRRRVEDTMLLLMRVYFEKPRTTSAGRTDQRPGHGRLLPHREGIGLARELLLFLADIGLPAATEALDPIMPQYLSELVTWTAIGARTTESQTHREMASGLSTPVGFKNGTDGSLAVAINAPAVGRSPAPLPRITQQDSRPCSAPVATATATSCCAAAAAAPTTIPSASPPASGSSSRRGCRPHRGGLQPRQLEQGPRTAVARSGERPRTRSCRATAPSSG